MDPRAERLARRAALAAKAEARTAAGRNAPRLVRWRRLRRRIGSWLLQLLAPLLVRLLALTWRVQRLGDVGFARQRSASPWIVAMWHGRMLALMPLRWHRGRRIGVLVSPSDDGGLAQQALRSFRYEVVRGSLSRGGARALREMHERVAAGRQLVVTPDGPRGPRHGINVGIAWLARSTGAPILPVGVAVSRAWRLRSWDRFTIPKPFARLCVLYGDPVTVAADASDAELEGVAQSVRAKLLELERQAFARLGIADDLDTAS
ncbi:MAG: lysophospholipid acyltransferase family protein [Planctomycetes bacterium]|nr:lysophospholipid acyltransferase family protein [Planctomycetota bacterium]